MLTLDGSEAWAATFNDKIIATELDISGNIDIDGTANLDAVDIDGAVQIDSTVTVGVDDTGYDVKFFGDTASAYHALGYVHRRFSFSRCCWTHYP